jgi:hypothetical protein
MSEAIWYDDYVAEPDEEFQIDEYDLTATPNDFNVLTINNFIESGAVKIPGFQRNYVWDIKRASKLIESLILGLPVPQIFLYEEGRNRFLVIDGQQRLMSIYYFIKQRFPHKEKRAALRRIFDQEGGVPDRVLHDDDYFGPFRLALPEQLPDRKNKFKGLNYATLGEYRTQFDLRPVRNVIVKQSRPPEDDSSVFEMFNRLNTGGINLRPQEIRGSLYHSPFYDMLHRINLVPGWRRLLKMPDPELHMKDVEILLRGFAMLVAGTDYRPSMSKFLNRFSRRSQGNAAELNTYLEALFGSFVEACRDLREDAFFSSRTNRFSIALYEAVFTVVSEKPLAARAIVDARLDPQVISTLDADPVFVEASEKASADKVNVERRLERARAILRA